MKDQLQRDKIQNNLDTNFVVDAGAGAGKTASLVNRIFSLMKNKKADVCNIVVITFTNKAASELMERVYDRFDKEINQKDLNLEIKQHLEYCYENISNMTIGTIHSFCTDILKEFPAEAGVDCNFVMLEENETEKLQKKVWHDFLDKLYVEDRESVAFCEENNINIDELELNFKFMCKYSDVTFPVDDVKIENEDIDLVFGKLKDFYLEVNLNKPEDSKTDNLSQWLFIFNEQLQYKQELSYKQKLNLILEFNKTISKKGFVKVNSWKDIKYAKELRDEIVTKIKDLYLDSFIKQCRAYFYAKLIRLIKTACDDYQKAKQKINSLDFADLLIKTAFILKEQSYVREYLQNKYRYVFIDEFQDTDPIQSQIALYLTADSLTEKDWKKCKPRNGSLFIVGDPKQSIYRFRRADISIYNEVKEIIKNNNGEELVLETNFRSSEPIVGFVNNVFNAKGFFEEQENNYQAKFSLMDANKKNMPGVIKKIEHKEKLKADEVVAKEAKIISSYILKEVNSGRRKLSDFLIITYTKNRMPVYISELERCGIKCSSSGDDKELYSIVLWDILRLFKFIANPFDEVLSYGVLRSGLFGLSDEVLAECRLGADSWIPDQVRKDRQETVIASGSEAISEISAQTGKDIKEVLNKINSYKDLFDKMSTANAFLYILKDIGILAYASLLKNKKREIEYILSLQEKVSANEMIKYKNLNELVEYLEDLIMNNKLRQMDVNVDKTDSARIMNLHKSKGLQAPVVFLVNPRGRLKSIKPNIHIKRQGDKDIGYMILKDAEPLEWEAFSKEEEKYLKAEEIRKLYVAVTRAEEELIVTYDDNSGNCWKELMPFLEEAETVIESDSEVISKVLDQTKKDNQETVIASDSEAILSQSLSDSHFREGGNPESQEIKSLITPSYIEKTISKQIKSQIQPKRISGGYGQVFGDLIHKTLDIITKNSKSDWQVFIKKEYEKIEEKKFEIQDVVLHIEKILDSNFWKELERIEEKYSEVPFVLKTDKEIIKGVIDLVFKQNNKWVIVDYKTDYIGHSDIDEFSCYYSEQIEFYKQYWEQITKEQVEKAGIYFTNINKFVESE
jgi:ATP-dependent helicase/nuclease subunit A